MRTKKWIKLSIEIITANVTIAGSFYGGYSPIEIELYPDEDVQNYEI